MTFNAILENRNNFFQLEPALEILFQYSDKYYGNRPNFQTVYEVIDKYLQEPIERRYFTEINQNKRKKESLLSKKEKLQKLTTFFIEKEMNSSNLDKILGRDSFSFFDLNFSINAKIYLCPFCASLLSEAASASFDIKDAERRAQEAAQQDDWDDDDW